MTHGIFRSPLAAFLVASVFCSPTVLSQDGSPEPGAPAAIFHETFSRPSGKGTLHLVAFDSSQYSLRVIDNGAWRALPKFASLADAVQRNGGVAGINGGFFDLQRFTPAGLMVADGRTISPFDAKGWQAGVLAVRGNRVSLFARDAFTDRSGITDGLQSSPWLIRAGRIDEAQRTDSRQARRVFVGTGKSGWCAIGFSTPVTFHELAELLTSEPVSKKIELTEVLALDGVTSAGFWCQVDGKPISDPELTTVRNFVAVVPAGSRVRAPRRNRTTIVVAAIIVVCGIAGVWIFSRRNRSAAS